MLQFFRKKKLFFTGICISGIFFILDQITKKLVFAKIDSLMEKTEGVRSHIQIAPFFNLVKVWNTGISFGMFQNIPYGALILSLTTILISIFVGYLLWKARTKYAVLYLSLILSGALGNLFDRVKFGAVADFLDFHLGKYHWPAFNVADSIIFIGVCMILFEDLVWKKTKSK